MEGVATAEAGRRCYEDGHEPPLWGRWSWRILFGLDVCVDIMHVPARRLGDPKIARARCSRNMLRRMAWAEIGARFLQAMIDDFFDLDPQ